MSYPIIHIKNISKKYVKKKKKFFDTKEYITAVDNISLDIYKGEVVGFIGMNGAGKTTTLKILSGLMIPDSGMVSVDGLDVVKDSHRVKSYVGAIAGEYARAFYWRLSGRQNLRLFAVLKGLSDPDDRINELLDIFDLSAYADEKTMKYSTGMKHKLALCMILLNDPSVLFLDEPLTGIDPASAFKIKKIIKGFKDKTIIWTSHNLYEIEEICDRIVLLHKGRIVFSGSPSDLRMKHTQYKKIIVQSDKPDVFVDHMLNCSLLNKRTVEIQVTDVEVALRIISTLSKTHDVHIENIQTMNKTLEDIFMEMVNGC